MSKILFITLILISWELVFIKCELLSDKNDLNLSETIVILNENKSNNNKDDLQKTVIAENIRDKNIDDKSSSSSSSNGKVEETNNLKPKRYDGAQLWRIPIFEEADKLNVKQLNDEYDAETWREIDNNVDLLLQQNKLQEAENLLKIKNISHVVLIEDLQRAIETENPSPEEIEELQNRKGHRMTWKAYHRLNDIHGYLNYLAQTYPDLCSVETIGYSTENRSLLLLKISNKKPGNTPIWIDGGMHAREWISPASVTYIIERLIQNWEHMPNYITRTDWYILPVVNPDGYEYTHVRDRLWRKNRGFARGSGCTGIDLNRNFGYNWGGKGTSANSCSDIYKGTKPFSEPESAAISNYMSRFGKNYFKGYVTLHSYGQYILYPWGHDSVLPADNADLNLLGRQAAANMLKIGGARYTVGSSATTLYPAAGGSDDWAKGVLNIKYSYTLEMRDTGRFGFILPANYIEVNGLEAMTFIETLAKAIVGIRG